MAEFRTEYLVRFRHCDMAGIVFYPRYVELLNDLVEDWYAAMGVPFAARFAEGFAVPMAAIDVQFDQPSRLGEVLTATLAVERVGRTSCRVAARLAGPDGGARVRFVATMVFVATATLRPEPWPAILRAAMAAYAPES